MPTARNVNALARSSNGTVAGEFLRLVFSGSSGGQYYRVVILAQRTKQYQRAADIIPSTLPSMDLCISESEATRLLAAS